MAFSCAFLYEIVIFVSFLLILKRTDAVGSVTWFEPPPVETVTDPTLVHTNSTKLRKGSTNVYLNWEFSVTSELNLVLVTLELDGALVGTIVPSTGDAALSASFTSRFNVSWVAQVATLIIFNVTSADEGLFTCELNTFEGGTNKIWNRNIDVSVVAPSRINYISKNHSVNQNDSIYLNCTAEGLPNPNISWSRLSDNRVVTMPLNITGRKDQGCHRCTAFNGIGDPDTADVCITVDKFSPENTSLTSSVIGNIVNVSQVFNITCSTEANPPAEFRFYADGKRLSNITTGNNTAVYTASVNERRSPVSYSCIPFNDYGNGLTRTITVIVHFPPTIKYAPSDEEVVEGKSLTVFCNATGNPQPDITWTKQGDSSVLSTSETLHRTNLSSEDNGKVYICTVNNSLGFDEANATITVFFAPNVTLRQCPTVVNESNDATLYCNATGNPVPSIKWIRRSTGDDTIVSSNNSLVFAAINRNESGLYQCIANNSVGNDSKNCTVDVQFPPKIDSAPSDEKVVEGNSLNLFCNATGNPQPDITWTKEGESSVLSTSETLKLTNLSSKDNGQVYICKVNNSLGFDEANATITVFFAPNVTLRQCPIVVNESNDATLNCNATGNPVPSIKWIRRSTGEITIVSNNSALVFVAINRNESGLYQCIANNSIGNDSKNCAVDVHYPPKIVKPTSSEKSELHSSSITVECVAEGRPDPWYVWTNVTDGTETHGRNLTIENVNFHDGRIYTYTCTATNDLGYDNRTASIEITSNRIRVQFTITMVDEKKAVFDNSKEDEIKNGLEEQVNTKFRNDSKYNRITDIYLRSGSIIVSFVILFKSPVTLSDGLAPLTAAVESGTLGPYTVKDLRAIEDVSPTTIPSDSPTSAGSTTAPVKPVDKTTSSREDGPPWGIIGGAIGAVVVVVIIVILVACWVHKKRKCRKDTKIHNSESEVLQGQNDIEDGVHAKVNGGYADAGPPSANGTNRFVQPQPEQQQQQQQAAAAPPDYAVVDKSKKKNKDNNNGNKNIPDYAVVDKSKKKKNKKAEAEDPYAEVEDPKKDKDKKKADPGTHDYAVVNKSKKKKKEEDENAYAVVDKSKKSKKKPKAPGEVLYADLDDFKPVQAPSMPTVSTSPEPLAPLKRPTSYQATEYADITQFLKGNATLPEGQSTEMEPTYANAGGGQEAANKENAKTGGEGGGGDTEHKETPM